MRHQIPGSVSDETVSHRKPEINTALLPATPLHILWPLSDLGSHGPGFTSVLSCQYAEVIRQLPPSWALTTSMVACIWPATGNLCSDGLAADQGRPRIPGSPFLSMLTTLTLPHTDYDKRQPLRDGTDEVGLRPQNLSYLTERKRSECSCTKNILSMCVCVYACLWRSHMEVRGQLWALSLPSTLYEVGSLLLCQANSMGSIQRFSCLISHWKLWDYSCVCLHA